MVFQSSRAPPASDKAQQSANHSGAPIAAEQSADKITDWLLVALNFFLVVSTGLLWRANNRSAKIAESALTGLERPWLFLEGTTISRRDLPGQQLIPNNWFIKLHWKNVGRAPALIEDCLFQIVPKANITNEPVYDKRSGISCPRTVAVGETIETFQVGPAPGKNEILVFYGRITYTELSGKRHETGFAVEVSPHMPACSPHNNDKYDYYT
jgi:hypothetical protein